MNVIKTLQPTRIVEGNSFNIRIPIQQITGYDASGQAILSDVDLTGCEDKTSVALHTLGKAITKSNTVTGNVVTFSVPGDLDAGYYDIEVTSEKSGEKLRFELKNALKIVQYSADADLPAGAEIGISTYTLQPQIVFAVGKSLTYADLTEEQIANLRKPATDAATLANSAAETANQAAVLANNAADAAKISASYADGLLTLKIGE